jgi:hypothetical protein
MTIEKVNCSLISIIIVGSVVVVNEGRGRLFRRKDGKYLLYVPLDLAEDSMFPFKTETSIKVKISFKIGENKLIIEEWKKESN